jgi:hypothetical protein
MHLLLGFEAQPNSHDLQITTKHEKADLRDLAFPQYMT